MDFGGGDALALGEPLDEGVVGRVLAVGAAVDVELVELAAGGAQGGLDD